MEPSPVSQVGYYKVGLYMSFSRPLNYPCVRESRLRELSLNSVYSVQSDRTSFAQLTDWVPHHLNEDDDAVGLDSYNQMLLKGPSICRRS